MLAASSRDIPSAWFQWHAAIIRPGMRVLDLACGRGCHAIAAAERGAHVVAVDNDAEILRSAEKAARKANVTVEWVQADLQRDPLPEGKFDIVMVFNYLDRARMSQFLDAVKPGGYFMLETFLEQQRELGWGPTSDEHLLKAGELWELVQPFEILLAREVVEILDGRSMAVSSILAQRPGE
ncbi:MAG: methyltransferase domain-containing protein [Gemmatimonadales bacterium]|nr:methyltransferase domain-containing protein [Gemmatimonadales bacterium]NIN10395.1 methyltransferase domain-containing protein [Gemmatimonadales bacterium]NIN49187.1 methyltransferase domain-containing protein [Gemmatimonadales bacterium]NIP06651.1 methyltransferase domain-containing protein [Gemmatimonadales bacterium]NIQ99981.1 methyltransferase domain-containing protein [Gemmatimonadales bacterium]